MIKNFIFVLKRFRTSSVLNITGLSVAFAVFIIIMMQVDYDYNFDRFSPDNEKIFRVDFVNSEGGKQSILCRPLVETLLQSSPHVVAGTFFGPWSGKGSIVVEKNGSRFTSIEKTQAVSSDYAKVFPFEIVEGTADALHNPDMLLIPQNMAKRLFGDAPCIDRMLEMWGKKYPVKGVYRDFPENSLIENSICFKLGNENETSWENWNYACYVRLDSPDAASNVTEVFNQTMQKESNPDHGFEKCGFSLTSLPDLHFTMDVNYDNSPKSSWQTLLVLLSVIVAIIVIAGINFTNFSMALVPRRIRSINTQKVFGASAGKLRVLLVAEAVLMAFVAYFIALFLVYAASKTPPIVELLDCGIHPLEYPKLLVATAAIAALTGLVSGLYPAFYITSFQPALALKGSFGLSIRGQQIRNTLMGLQFTASFVLITCALFMYFQNRYMQSIPMGFNRDQIIITELTGEVKKNYSVLENDLKSFAGIEDLTYGQFLLASSDTYMGWGRRYQDKSIQFFCLPVSPSFLKIMGIKVSEGRDFRDDDRLGRRGKYIFNEKARHEYDIQLNTDIDSSEIIGFIPDIQFTTFHTAPTPMAFYVWGTENWGDNNSFAYIKVKAGSNQREAIQHVKNTMKKLDPEWSFNV
ncbi:MAG: ABC transporter permease, partial [Dysgonamonadaceae bacterium]|nr:ABC transporter permease [Dysgonamonadaceae bacterium]